MLVFKVRKHLLFSTYTKKEAMHWGDLKLTTMSVFRVSYFFFQLAATGSFISPYQHHVKSIFLWTACTLAARIECSSERERVSAGWMLLQRTCSFPHRNDKLLLPPWPQGLVSYCFVYKHIYINAKSSWPHFLERCLRMEHNTYYSQSTVFW